MVKKIKKLTMREKRAKGLVNIVRNFEAITDAALDNNRVGMHHPGVRTAAKRMPTRTVAQKAAAGKASAASSKKRRGGMSMSGMGGRNDPKYAELMAKAKKYGTPIVRVQQAMEHFSRSPNPRVFSDKMGERAKTRLKAVKTRRVAKNKQKRDSNGRFA